jgi:hypothetical protein
MLIAQKKNQHHMKQPTFRSAVFFRHPKKFQRKHRTATPDNKRNRHAAPLHKTTWEPHASVKHRLFFGSINFSLFFSKIQTRFLTATFPNFYLQSRRYFSIDLPQGPQHHLSPSKGEQTLVCFLFEKYLFLFKNQIHQ